MRYYETLYIVNPNNEQDRLDAVMEEVKTEIVKHKVQVINHRVWGKKRLAYPIQKHKYGNYVMLQFESENTENLSEFDMWLKLNNAILRFQTIRLEARPEEVVETSSEKPVEKPVEKTDQPETSNPVAEEQASDLQEDESKQDSADKEPEEQPVEEETGDSTS